MYYIIAVVRNRCLVLPEFRAWTGSERPATVIVL